MPDNSLLDAGEVALGNSNDSDGSLDASPDGEEQVRRIYPCEGRQRLCRMKKDRGPYFGPFPTEGLQPLGKVQVAQLHLEDRNIILRVHKP